MKNMGSVDRIIRAIVGLVLIIAAVFLQLNTEQFWWIGIPGAVFLLTAAISACPLYLPFRVSTLKKSK